MTRKRLLINKIKQLIFDLLFPKFCLNCGEQDTYLCQDCLALIDLCQEPFRQTKNLSALYFACDSNNFVVQKILNKFKDPPFAKDLAANLAFLIILHFQNLENPPPFLIENKDLVILPMPIQTKRLRFIGFNPAQEIAKHLAEALQIPLCNWQSLENKRVLLVKETFNEQMEEVAQELKQKGVKQVWGVTVVK
jgi:predicted amidophosphoribosyltransferase